MKQSGRIAIVTVAAAFLGTAALAQDPEPPFTWKGKGQVSYLSEQGVKEANFNFELAVDTDGAVKGKTTSDDGSSTIKHVFYGERVEHAVPGMHSRKAIVVLLIDQGSEPLLVALNGRLLAGRFFTAEALVKRSDPSSETDKALGVGDPIATPIDEDALPASLKAALKKLTPLGTVKIEGAFGK